MLQNSFMNINTISALNTEGSVKQQIQFPVRNYVEFLEYMQV